MINKVKKVLDGYNMLYTEEEVNHGIKLTLINKVHITVYSNGTVLVQGTEPSKSNIETILGIKQKMYTITVVYNAGHTITHLEIDSYEIANSCLAIIKNEKTTLITPLSHIREIQIETLNKQQ